MIIASQNMKMMVLNGKNLMTVEVEVVLLKYPWIRMMNGILMTRSGCADDRTSVFITEGTQLFSNIFWDVEFWGWGDESKVFFHSSNLVF